MKNTEMKRIITILLVIGLISTQFVFAASEQVGEDNGYVSEVNETEMTDFSDEGESEVVTEPADEDVTVLEDISSRTEDESNEDESPEGSVIYDETAEGNVYDGREPDDPPLRSLPENYFTDPFDAADYLDEKIVDYLENNGSANITIYIHYGDNEIGEAYQAALFSHLYNSFCGYDNNFFYSILNNHESEEYDNILYYKFTYYFNAVLTRTDAISAWTAAQNIAYEANQIQSLTDKINYIYNVIGYLIDYHNVNHGNPPTDGCDTAYSLCTGDAICGGFTGAFCLICYEAGLNSVPLWGCIKNNTTSTVGHAWNIIEIGNTWEQVDCTNEMSLFTIDPYSTRGVYDLFGQAFKQNHIINTITNCWIETSSGRTYIDSYGYSLTQQWKADQNGWCYLDENGCILYNTWFNYSGEWYFLKADGYMATNEWAQDSIGWCYMNSSGHITRSAWIQKNNYWYYLKANGYRAENEWIQDSIDWCYMGSDGKMVTNDWAQDSIGWCYLDSNGHIIRSQWLLKNNEWYYLKSDGHMATNEWAQDSIGWCYLDSSGHITRSQWLLKNNEWYYLKADGHMAVNDWAQDSVGWCYMDSNGHITRSAWIQKNNYWYYLKSNGYRAESEWAQDSIGYCWMGSDGKCDTGTKWIGSPRYIGSSYILSGHRVDSRTIAIDGYNCTFNGGGKLVSFSQITGPTPEPV